MVDRQLMRAEYRMATWYLLAPVIVLNWRLPVAIVAIVTANALWQQQAVAVGSCDKLLCAVPLNGICHAKGIQSATTRTGFSLLVCVHGFVISWNSVCGK